MIFTNFPSTVYVQTHMKMQPKMYFYHWNVFLKAVILCLALIDTLDNHAEYENIETSVKLGSAPIMNYHDSKRVGKKFKSCLEDAWL